MDQAIRAFDEGADYIGFGPIFTTPTKPDYLPIGFHDIRAVHDAVRIPIFCIGGIKQENLPAVISAGARRAVHYLRSLQRQVPVRGVQRDAVRSPGKRFDHVGEVIAIDVGRGTRMVVSATIASGNSR